MRAHSGSSSCWPVFLLDVCSRPSPPPRNRLDLGPGLHRKVGRGSSSHSSLCPAGWAGVLDWVLGLSAAHLSGRGGGVISSTVLAARCPLGAYAIWGVAWPLPARSWALDTLAVGAGL